MEDVKSEEIKEGVTKKFFFLNLSSTTGLLSHTSAIVCYTLALTTGLLSHISASTQTCLKYINHEVAHIPPQFPFSAPPHIFPIPNNSPMTTNLVAIL